MQRLLENLIEVFPALRAPNILLTTADATPDEEVNGVEEEFADKVDWTRISGPFLDQAPKGWGSALSLFSNEALCFYLPAYISAALRGELRQVDLVSHLITGLDGSYSSNHAKPGRLTSQERALNRWQPLSHSQRLAVGEFLRSIADENSVWSSEISSALERFWLKNK